MKALIAALLGLAVPVSALGATYEETTPNEYYGTSLALDLGTNTISGQIGAFGSGVAGSGAWYMSEDYEYFTLSGPSNAKVVAFSLVIDNGTLTSDMYSLYGGATSQLSLNAGGESASENFALIDASGTSGPTAFDLSDPNFGKPLGQFSASDLLVYLSAPRFSLSISNPAADGDPYGYSLTADWQLNIELEAVGAEVPLPATGGLLLGAFMALAGYRRGSRRG